MGHRVTGIALALAFLTAALPLPLSAAPTTPTGLLDMDASGLPQGAAVDITMGRAQLAALSLGAGDATTAELLSGLETVHLRQYLTPSDEIVAVAEGLPAQLEAAGWVQTQHQVHENRHLFIHALSDAGSCAGFVVLVIDPGVLVAIANVVGDVPPAQLAQLGLPLTP